MSDLVFRSMDEPVRENLDWYQLWKGSDKGLIISWEIGRNLATNNLNLANKAKNGELPVLAWTGGVERKLKMPVKYGSMFYLAQWLGLRGEDLSIAPSAEVTKVCTRTQQVVTYTSNLLMFVADGQE